MVKAIISYCHTDERGRDRLQVHLTTLQRDDLLSTWTDCEILAGDHIDNTISKALEDSSIFIALVSPDYLNSRYCYDVEFARAMELQQIGSMRIVPVILEPCDWTSTPLGKFKGIPKDGRAISLWTNENAAFLNVTSELRALLNASSMPRKAASNIRTKRDFDAIDRNEFQDRAFEIISRYFNDSCIEVAGVEGIKAKFNSMHSAAFTCTIVNRGKRNHPGASMTVTNSKRENTLGAGIIYSYQPYAPSNTSNGTFNVADDGYALHLVKHDFHSDDKDQLSPEQAAELLWHDIAKRAEME
jgi:hypothetical protein